MQLPLQINVHGLPHSEALEARVREHAAKLEEFHSRIVSCRVTVEESRKRRGKGRHFQVRVDVRIPGKEIVASHDHDEDVYVAVRDAFQAVRRQLEDAVREMRGDTKSHEARPGSTTREEQS